jgi:hypothetical protein
MTFAEAMQQHRYGETEADTIRRLGYDGLCALYDDCGEDFCGCGVNDPLMWCQDDPSDCELAYVHKVIDGRCEDIGGRHCDDCGEFAGQDDILCPVPRGKEDTR